MSCYVVEDRHLLYLVLAATKYRAEITLTRAAQGEETMEPLPFAIDARRLDALELPESEVGEQQCKRLLRVLWLANVLSYRTRYIHNEDAMRERYLLPKWEYHFEWVEAITPIQTIKACHCYHYQACEVEDFEETDAARAVDRIARAASEALPGYNAAQWGVPEFPPLRGVVSLTSMMRKAKR